jgi:hypothetical protein
MTNPQAVILRRAAIRGDTRTVKLCLQLQADVNSQGAVRDPPHCPVFCLISFPRSAATLHFIMQRFMDTSTAYVACAKPVQT